MVSKEYCTHSSWGLRQYLGEGKLVHVSLQLMQVVSRVPLEEPNLVFQVCAVQELLEMNSKGLMSPLPLISVVQRQVDPSAENCRNLGFCAC